VRGVPSEEFHPFCYTLSDVEAVRHLFTVSAGLDSLVIGEPQILGQVTRALELSRAQGTAGPVLNRLFQAAIHAGKRARTETNISRNPASVSSLAASVAERAVPYMQEARVLILGAGEMAELTVEALRKRGVEKITVINRTLERARDLAQRWGARSATFEFLEESLVDADILISSTGAPHLMVTAEMVARSMHSRAQRPLMLIDIALPRDIDPEAADIPHVKLIDIDGLNAKLEHSLSERMAEVPHVEAILEEELAESAAYLRSLDVLPLIAGIHQRAEAIRQAELEKTLRRLPDLSANEIERIEAMTQALVRKLLEAPTHRLREEATHTHGPEYTIVARRLFGLEKNEGSADHPTAAD
jgi:glutamyl-tRNA reductase